MIAASKRNWRQIALTFVGDAKGAIAPLFALIAVPVLGIAMTAYDYNRAEGMRAKLQVAVDNAAAAAAQRLEHDHFISKHILSFGSSWHILLAGTRGGCCRCASKWRQQCVLQPFAAAP